MLNSHEYRQKYEKMNECFMDGILNFEVELGVMYQV